MFWDGSPPRDMPDANSPPADHVKWIRKTARKLLGNWPELVALQRRDQQGQALSDDEHRRLDDARADRMYLWKELTRYLPEVAARCTEMKYFGGGAYPDWWQVEYRNDEAVVPDDAKIAQELRIIADTAGPMCVVVLGETPTDLPTVFGETTSQLTTSQYRVIEAMIEAGPDGLAKESLKAESKCSGAVDVLKRLAKKNRWQQAIILPGPGGMGKHYRLLWQ